MKTLSAWLAAHPRAYSEPVARTPVHRVFPNGEDTSGLFHLDDFAVSAACGGPHLVLSPRITYHAQT